MVVCFALWRYDPFRITMIFVILAWTSFWINNRVADALRRHGAHVTLFNWFSNVLSSLLPTGRYYWAISRVNDVIILTCTALGNDPCGTPNQYSIQPVCLGKRPTRHVTSLDPYTLKHMFDRRMSIIGKKGTTNSIFKFRFRFAKFK